MLAGLDELRHYAHDGVTGTAKPIPAEAPEGYSRRVDADKPSCRIRQRPTELPGLMAASVWIR